MFSGNFWPVFKKILKWGAVTVAVLYVVVVLVRIPHFYNLRKTEEQVVKIHATKLTLDDVAGINLPPDPGALADATIEGVDANQNGIRDDVELAIFKEYPNSARTRAVLLQYALALQMEMMQPIVNAGTVGAVANKADQAFFCVTKIVPKVGDVSRAIVVIENYEKFLLDKQFNTEVRKNTRKDFYEHLGSGTTGESSCDIDLDSLPN